MTVPPLSIVLLLLLVLAVSASADDNPNEIQVINSGTGRTGSTTLHEALNILGYKAYHMKEIMLHRGDDLDFWMDAFTTNCSKPEQLRELFASGHYTASAHPIHWPCLEEMIFNLYPNAKVIHTQRASAELWHDSVSHSICQTSLQKKLFFKLLGFVLPVFRKFPQFAPHLLGQAAFGHPLESFDQISTEFCMSHKDQMISHYNAHNARIQEIVPSERLLVISNHKDGWDTLCQFLGKPIPDVPFPHVNKRENMFRLLFLKLLETHFGMTGGTVAAAVIGIVVVIVMLRLRTNATTKGKKKRE